MILWHNIYQEQHYHVCLAQVRGFEGVLTEYIREWEVDAPSVHVGVLHRIETVFPKRTTDPYILCLLV